MAFTIGKDKKLFELTKGAHVRYRKGNFLATCPNNRKTNFVFWVVLKAVMVKMNSNIKLLVIYWLLSLSG